MRAFTLDRDLPATQRGLRIHGLLACQLGLFERCGLQGIKPLHPLSCEVFRFGFVHIMAVHAGKHLSFMHKIALRDQYPLDAPGCDGTDSPGTVVGEGDSAGHAEHVRRGGLLDGVGLDDVPLLIHRNYNFRFCGGPFWRALFA